MLVYQRVNPMINNCGLDPFAHILEVIIRKSLYRFGSVHLFHPHLPEKIGVMVICLPSDLVIWQWNL